MLWEISILAPPELEEPLTDLLTDLDSMGVSVEDAGDRPVFDPGGRFAACRIKGYFEENRDRDEIAAQARRLLNDPTANDAVSWQPLEDQDWQEAWKKGIEPIEIGTTLLILPTWLEAPPNHGRTLIRLDPQMAFGTGSHETTAGCLEALERLSHERPLERVLDLGTGSGLLAIGAALLGAEEILATDNDPVAVDTCMENARLNKVDARIACQLREDVPPGIFTAVTANILAPVLTQLAAPLAQALSPGGTLILSGILEEQAEEVIAAYRNQTIHFAPPTLHGEWVVLTGTKENQT